MQTFSLVHLYDLWEHIFTIFVSPNQCQCCDRKSWAAYAQSFALWQQATIEITRQDHSIIACSRHIDINILCVHPVNGLVNHTFNAMPLERLQQHPLLFTMNRTDRVFLWRLHTARPPHSGHSTILLRSEILSGICAKLCTVATINNRDHLTRSLYFCMFAPHSYIIVLRIRTSRSWWITHSTQCHWRSCNSSTSSIFLEQNARMHGGELCFMWCIIAQPSYNWLLKIVFSLFPLHSHEAWHRYNKIEHFKCIIS